MNENDMRQLVNEYLTHCCDDIVDYAQEWCTDEHGEDMTGNDIDTFASLVEEEVRIWILLGSSNAKDKENNDGGEPA